MYRPLFPQFQQVGFAPIEVFGGGNDVALYVQWMVGVGGCQTEVLVFGAFPFVAIVHDFPSAGLQTGVFHRKVERKDVGHGIGCASFADSDGSAEEDDASAFGEYLPSSFCMVAQGFHQLVTPVELAGEEFGVASRQIDEVGFGKVAAIDGAEVGYLSYPFQLIHVRTVGEAEGGIARYSYLDSAHRRNEGIEPDFGGVWKGVSAREIAVAEIDDSVDIHLIFNDLGYPVNLLVQLFTGGERECKVLGWQLQIVGIWEVSQAVDSGIGARFAQAVVVRLGGHHVEYHSCYAGVAMEVLEAIDEWGNGIACHTGIDDQQDGYIEQSGHLGTAALCLLVAVEQASCAFGYADIGPFAVLVVHVLKVGVRGEPGVEVYRFVVGCKGEQLGIHEVGTAFVGLCVEPTVLEGTYQA